MNTANSLISGFLLDSQVLMWLGPDRHKLGATTKRLLRFQDLYFSTISVAELGFKSQRSRISFGSADLEDWEKFGMLELPFSRNAAIEFASFHSHQVPDPMDRQIMAVARANGLGLITADKKILNLELDWVVDATT